MNLETPPSPAQLPGATLSDGARPVVPVWWHRPQWWPMWAFVLAVGFVLVLIGLDIAGGPRPRHLHLDELIAPYLLILGLGLLLECGLLAMIPERWFARPRRVIAGLTAAIAIGSVIWDCGEVLLRLLDEIYPMPKALVPSALDAGGLYADMLWGILLVVVAPIFALIGVVRSGEPAASDVPPER